MLRLVRIITLAAFAALPSTMASAQSDMFKGQTVTIVTSTGAGGNYDLIARMMARHMPRHMPGQPNMIVQNMPGAGNVLATNFMYNVAPKDGTTIAVVNNTIPLHQVVDGNGVRYDASKFNWLGSTGTRNSLTYIWHTAGINSIQEVMEKEVVLGGTGPASDVVMFPRVMNNVIGTKFRIVIGYKSSAEMYLAMERNEIQARVGSMSSLVTDYPSWVKDKKVVFLVQIGAKREAALPDVPLLTELAKTEEQRQIIQLISSPIALGQPYLAPPDVPADRVAILRQAFMSTLRDKTFLEEASKIDFDFDPLPGEEVAKIVNETIGTPPAVIAKAKAAMAAPEGK